jgi:hypothetical protein
VRAPSTCLLAEVTDQSVVVFGWVEVYGVSSTGFCAPTTIMAQAAFSIHVHVFLLGVEVYHRWIQWAGLLALTFIWSALYADRLNGLGHGSHPLLYLDSAEFPVEQAIVVERAG